MRGPLRALPCRCNEILGAVCRRRISRPGCLRAPSLGRGCRRCCSYVGLAGAIGRPVIDWYVFPSQSAGHRPSLTVVPVRIRIYPHRVVVVRNDHRISFVRSHCLPCRVIKVGRSLRPYSRCSRCNCHESTCLYQFSHLDSPQARNAIRCAITHRQRKVQPSSSASGRKIRQEIRFEMNQERTDHAMLLRHSALHRTK